MRRVSLLLLAGCGRIGFGEVAPGDGGGSEGVPATGFAHVVAYAHQTCGLANHRAYCWGNNDAGQLGDASLLMRAAPHELVLPAGTVTAIAPGDAHGCAIVDGGLYCFGKSFGATPRPIQLPAAATAVSAGRDFTCVLAGQVLCFGINDAGQLGDGTMAPHEGPLPIQSTDIFVALRAGDDHACALNAQNAALCWGHNDDGALGFGNFTPTQQLIPTAVASTVHTLPAIAGWHACALENGTVSCWGRNTEGEIGDGGNTRKATPVPVPNLASVTAFATGGGPTDFDATCACVGDHDVRCWGAGMFGRLGNGGTGNSAQPIPVTGLPAKRIRELAVAYDHACALFDDGDLYCWGRGDLGQLGNGTMQSSLAPVRVTPP